MQVEQKNIWEDVTRNAKRDNSNRAIAAYQANMPDAGAVAAFGGQEAYVQQKTAVSKAGNIDMATYSNPAKQGQEEKTVAEKIAGQEISSGQARSNEIAVVANTTSTEDLKKMEEDGFSISDGPPCIFNRLQYNRHIICGGGGMADTHASGACAFSSVRVQIPFSA